MIDASRKKYTREAKEAKEAAERDGPIVVPSMFVLLGGEKVLNSVGRMARRAAKVAAVPALRALKREGWKFRRVPAQDGDAFMVDSPDASVRVVVALRGKGDE